MNQLNTTIGNRWTISSLLFFATTVNSLDRQVSSLLQPLLSEQFNWTDSQYANHAAVFQCNIIGSWVENGECPADLATLG